MMFSCYDTKCQRLSKVKRSKSNKASATRNLLKFWIIYFLVPKSEYTNYYESFMTCMTIFQELYKRRQCMCGMASIYSHLDQETAIRCLPSHTQNGTQLSESKLFEAYVKILQTLNNGVSGWRAAESAGTESHPLQSQPADCGACCALKGSGMFACERERVQESARRSPLLLHRQRPSRGGESRPHRGR